MNSDIIFQAFKWDARHNNRIGNWYNLLNSKVRQLKDIGFNYVWFPPACKSRVQDWVGYTPMDYYDLGEYKQWVQEWNGKEYVWKQHAGKETLYGTKNELISVLTNMNASGMSCIIDVVLNHRDFQQVNYYGEPVSWGSSEHKIASGKMVWGDSENRPAGAEFWDNDRPEELATWYGGGSTYVDDGEYGFSSNLAHENPDVRKEIIDWMKWLKAEIGFTGWRYDYVKGYNATRVKEYNASTNPTISIGEYWDGDVKKITDWIDKTGDDHTPQSMAFDFPLQSHLRQIFYGAKSFDQLGQWKIDSAKLALIKKMPGNAVTFLDNHDTIRNADSCFPLDDKRLIQGHVFLLTHPGVPCIFWTHLFERNQKIYDAIKSLCKIRIEQNISSTSVVEIIEWQKCYVAKIDDHVLVQIGDYIWNPDTQSGNWKLKLNGDGWAIWTK